MRVIRFRIAGLMVTVLVVALGLAAVRNGSEIWAGVTFLMTCGVLCLAIVGAVCRRDTERAWWLGFALFGWGYLALAFWSSVELPTMALLDAIASRLGAKVQFSGGIGGIRGMRNVGLWTFGGFGGFVPTPAVPGQPLPQIAHCLWALAAALLGGSLARVLFGGSKVHPQNVESVTPTATHDPRRWWLWPAVLWTAGCLAIVLLVVIGPGSVSGFWIGATFLATSWLLAIAVLGTVSDHGKRRQVWLGAAIFGIGYMTMAFGRSLDRETWPSLPTDHLLHAVRRLYPPVISGDSTSADGAVSANARIWAALQQPVPMHFPEDTPLEDILKHIQNETGSTPGKGIPIYVDPIGLQEAERSLTSVVAIDLEGVALKTTLRLLLKQLALSYSIRDGLLLITSEESEVKQIYQDDFMIVGHCLLALLAAGFGGVVALAFRGKRRELPQ